MMGLLIKKCVFSKCEEVKKSKIITFLYENQGNLCIALKGDYICLGCFPLPFRANVLSE